MGAALVAALVVGCGEDDVEGDPGLDGELSVATAGTSYPLVRAAADQFQIENRSATIVITRVHPGRVKPDCRRRPEIVASSRRLTRRETRACGVDHDALELPSDGGGEAVYLYSAATPGPLTQAFGAFVAEHDELIAEAAADGRRALAR